MMWLPSRGPQSDGWRFDAAPLLAVIGDASIKYHAQTMTASWWCLLPRLIPAPQALLTFQRVTRLPSAPATVVGVQSGVLVRDLNFYGNLIHKLERLGRFEYQEFNVKRKENQKGKRTTKNEENSSRNGVGDKARRESHNDRPDPEKPNIQEKPSLAKVCVSRWSWVNWATMISFIITWALFGIALGIFQDAVAAIAIFVLAIQTSCVGTALRWKPGLSPKPRANKVPEGGVVMRTREGAFVYVDCADDAVARELYIGTEILDYRISSNRISDTLMMFGTVLIMMGVILIGNSAWQMQAIIGGAYAFLNFLYWAVALRRTESNWDLDRHYEGLKPVDRRWFPGEKNQKNELEPNFTLTLWHTICRTKSTQWVLTSGATPNTPHWKMWLDLAGLYIDLPDWGAVRVKDFLIELAEEGKSPTLPDEKLMFPNRNSQSSLPGRVVEKDGKLVMDTSNKVALKNDAHAQHAPAEVPNVANIHNGMRV